MTTLPLCPRAAQALLNEDSRLYICPECAHERSAGVVTEAAERGLGVCDAYGNALQGCKTDGIGAMQLKSEFVKKA